MRPLHNLKHIESWALAPSLSGLNKALHLNRFILNLQALSSLYKPHHTDMRENGLINKKIVREQRNL